MRLSDLLHPQQRVIEERWLERVRPLAPREGLTREELVDSLPAFLGELARALRHLEDPSVASALPERSPVAEAHGRQRHRLGYTIEAVAREYPLLHEVVLVVAAASGVRASARESILLARCMGTAAAESLSHFATAGTQALESGARRALLQHALDEEQLGLVRAAEARARAAQAEAEAERRKLHDIFEQAPIVIAITEGPEHLITFANPAYCALLQGLDPVGKRVREVSPGYEDQGFGALLDGVVASGKPFVGREVPVRLPHHAPDETGYMDFVYQPMRGPDGTVTGVLACGFEVTEQVRARQAAERLAAELRLRAGFEERLIGIVGHDLRQPLQGITVSAEALLRRPGLDARAHAGVERIRGAAGRMQRMLRDILDFTRARVGGGIPLARRPGDVAQLAREAAEEVELAHPGRHVEVHAEGSGQGAWDADRLRQVFDNLLSNALAYSPADSVVRLEVDGRAEGAVSVHVRNAGAAIPPELRPVLFEPLTRGAGPGGRERSVGLGLYIVRHLVEAHGGSVDVASEDGAGTVFTVQLPRGGG